MEPYAEVVDAYADFAAYARGDSPCFAAWADGVAGDPDVLAWLAALPALKRQPNLVFAAARWHGVPAPGPYAGLRAALLDDDGTIRATILARATQTNEAGRLATLVPAFARLGGAEPLALLEVGASAGLCLYPDRWSYRWATDDGVVEAGTGPMLRCAVTGGFPDRVDVPRVAWRGGIDLNPLDVTDADQMAWLTMLVWPEHDDRRRLLTTAIEVARADPPTIVAGDLLTELPARVDEAARHGRVVVFHSAVVGLPRPAGPPPVRRADDRAWSPTAAATGSPTRARTCCPGSRRPDPWTRRCRSRSCSASTGGRSPGRTGTAGR